MWDIGWKKQLYTTMVAAMSAPYQRSALEKKKDWTADFYATYRNSGHSIVLARPPILRQEEGWHG